jgi:ATP-dependent protease ClpP protease subunit
MPDDVQPWRPHPPEELEKFAAEAAKFKAEAAKARAEARKALADAEQAEAFAAMEAFDLERAVEKRERERATDQRHRVYRFVGDVGSGSVKACMDELTVWSRIDPACRMEIIFQSPGGDVVSGLALWDFLQEQRGAGHHLTTVARGYAASMAGILLQAGDVRIMGKESWLLVHEASFGVIGSFGEVEDRVEWVRKVQGRILDIFAARSKLSKAQIKRRWHRKDWWLDSDSALKYGFVDEVR